MDSQKLSHENQNDQTNSFRSWLRLRRNYLMFFSEESTLWSSFRWLRAGSHWKDQLLMLNFHMQFTKLIFFSFFMTDFWEERRSTKLTVVSVVHRFTQLTSKDSSVVSQRLFSEKFIREDHWDGQKFFRLILGVNSWVMAQEKWRSMIWG